MGNFNSISKPLALAFIALLLLVVIVPGSIALSQYARPRLRVIILSVDAVRFDHIVELASMGYLPNIAKLLAGGAYGDMVVVFPTATAVSHAAISTGAPPATNGIVGNAIHLPNTSIVATVSGFSGFYMLSEPLWIAAERQGLKAIVVSFPQSTPPAWRVNKSILFNIYDASAAFTYSTLYTTNRSVAGATYISFANASGWLNVERVLGKVVKALESSIRICDTTWYLYLADVDGDGLFDMLAIAPEKDLSKAFAVLREGEWSKPINTTVACGGKQYTVAPLFKALKLNPLTNFRLYRGTTRPFEAPWYSNASIAWSVWNNVIVRTGTFTDGDYYGLSRGWFDEETYMETVNFTNRLFMEWTLYMIKNFDWDLLMTYTPIIDNVYHQFLGLADPSMPYTTPEKAKYYWNLIVRAYKMVDEFVGAIISAAPPNTAIIIVSDHGQTPIKKIVYINGILYNNGYIGVDERFMVDPGKTIAYAPWSTHIYINLAGRELGGIVPRENYTNVVSRIVELLRNYRDPETGEKVFELVVTRDEAGFLGLVSERVGDIIVAVKPGYTISTALVKDPATGKAVEITSAKPFATVTGDHGPHLPYHKELRAVFIAFGPGIRGGYIGTVSSLQIAPTVAMLLGIAPPRDAKLAPVPIAIEVTQTVTQTLLQTMTKEVTTTYTKAYTVTSTLRETVRETVTVSTTATVTITQTQRETITSAITSIATYTTTVATVNYTSLAVAAVITFALGLAVGYVMKKK